MKQKSMTKCEKTQHIKQKYNIMFRKIGQNYYKLCNKIKFLKIIRYWAKGIIKFDIISCLLSFQVLLAQCTIHSGKCEKTCAQLEIEEHTECECECEIKRHHCNDKQVSSLLKHHQPIL